MPPPPNHVVRFGLPFIMFMVLGTSGLAYVTQGRYDLKDAREQQRDLMIEQDRVSLPYNTGDPSERRSLLDGVNDPQDYDMKRIPR